jgi:hypothetical protein
VAYADLARVIARSGGVLADLSATSAPTEAEVEQMILDVDAEVRAAIRARGLTPPDDDSEAGRALAGCVANGALVAAGSARFPSGAPSGTPEVVLERAVAAWEACQAALADGTHPVVVEIDYASTGGGGGATATWVDEPTYSPDPRYPWTSPAGAPNPYLEPAIHRGMRL